jgi:hypothetical protein
MIRYKVLSWRGIPAQIKVYGEGRPLARQLPDSFQEEIDRVAMREGMAGTEAYLEAWEWTGMLDFEGEAADVGEAADAVIAELIRKHAEEA